MTMLKAKNDETTYFKVSHHASRRATITDLMYKEATTNKEKTYTLKPVGSKENESLMDMLGYVSTNEINKKDKTVKTKYYSLKNSTDFYERLLNEKNEYNNLEVYFIAWKSDNPQKAPMRGMMRDDLNHNDISSYLFFNPLKINLYFYTKFCTSIQNTVHLNDTLMCTYDILDDCQS